MSIEAEKIVVVCAGGGTLTPTEIAKYMRIANERIKEQFRRVVVRKHPGFIELEIDTGRPGVRYTEYIGKEESE